MSRRPALAALALLAGLAQGCGADREQGGAGGAAAGRFPDAAGRTLTEVLREGESGEPVLAPGMMVLRPGRNRYGFGLFTVAREPLEGVDAAALYVARGATGRALGPFPVRIESLEVEPRFRAKTTSEDPDAAKVVYAAGLRFGRTGEYRVGALIRRGDRLQAAGPVSAVVKRWASIPKAGDPAPRVSTPTVASVGGKVSKIETREPPDSMHEQDLARVLGRKPVVLLFATPRLCQSRVCGPVVDVAEQVKARFGRRAAFIHMEIYRDNRVERGLRPQLVAYGLQTEPWLFVIGARGIVRTAIEGAFGARELEQAVAGAVGRA